MQTADLLAGIPLRVGHYNEIRLLVDDAPMANHLKLKDGSFADLKIPGGRTAG